MWILESKGDFFQGRRMWLKPGKQYLFGRVKNNGVQFALAYKTVSRKHFVISIDNVRDEDVAKTHNRTKITITDQKSKTGTIVNNEILKDITREISKDLSLSENIIRVGGSEEEIVVRWEPYVLTFNLLKKEIKAGVLKARQERVKDLDIKAVGEYIPGTTTHLVVNKRNTAKGLQALIDGVWLVADSWLDAFEYAATPADLDEEEHLSPLEQDFNKAWPDPKSHLPPPGKERTTQSVIAYEPNFERTNIFENFTFVFGDQTQYDNLLPPITTGHGKALLYKVIDGDTTAEELVAYLKSVAGSKGFGIFQKDIDKGGVILVRWSNTENENWTNELINQVALTLDQRVIDQSEFLDAILANDAFSLRQAVPYETNGDGIQVNSSAAASLVSITQPSQRSKQNGTGPQGSSHGPEVVSRNDLYQSSISHAQSVESESQNHNSSEIVEGSMLSKRPRYMVSKAKAGRGLDFDDDFDPNAIIAYDDNDEDASAAPSQSQPEDSVAASMARSEISDQAESLTHEPASVRKRLRNSPGTLASDIGDDGLDDLLPGAAAMKRQKISEGRSIVKGTDTTKVKAKVGVILPAPRSRTAKDIDIKEELRAKRTAEKEAARKADENRDKDIDHDESGNLQVYDVKTELIDVPLRTKTVSTSDAGQGDRWDPKWNGRKNFKAFKRARDNVNGSGVDRRRIHTRVIVPLVDAVNATYGIGDQYWDRTEEDKERERAKKKRASQRTQSQKTNSAEQALSSRSQASQTMRETDDSDVPNGNEVNDDQEISPELTRLQNEAAEILDHDIDVNEPRHTRADDRAGTQTQTQSTAETTHGVKRPAEPVTGRGGTTAKRQKTLPVTTIHGSDSDDSDDMKFRFGRGRRGRGKF